VVVVVLPLTTAHQVAAEVVAGLITDQDQAQQAKVMQEELV
jgi:hypothetical protein